MMRIDYEQVIQKLSLLPKLREFDPYIIGTPPLGIDLETSDIDIACSADDLVHFENVVSTEFNIFNDFQCRNSNMQNQNSVIVQFQAYDWDIELFCQTIPTNQQWGVRHFNIEQRLLNIEPKLRSMVLRLKQEGLKTEPAFARALGLQGDPYASILNLENMNDAELVHLIASK